MYRMFCMSYLNYMKVNQYEAHQYGMHPGSNSSSQDTPNRGQHCMEPYRWFRLEITRPIGVLADFTLYSEIRNGGGELFLEVSNLIFAIQHSQDVFPSFRAFSWELRGYGFDAEQHDGFPAEVIEEQLKLIDLLLSCHYWLGVPIAFRETVQNERHT